MLKKWSVTAKIELGDFTNLQFNDNEFDCIFDIVSMQHVNFEQHRLSYNEIYRCLKPQGKFYSYHLGENSISFKSTTEMVDHCTVKNITPGYPLANNGQTCFLSGNEVRKILKETGFKNIIIDKNTRSYQNQIKYIEYLSISSEK
jgi:ubiquinone/menaquinone biosynthesis C-methylase UbiE